MPNRLSARESISDRIPQVAIALPMNAKIPRDMRRGILRYAKEFGPWMIHLLEGREFSQKITDLRMDDLSGFIGYIDSEDDIKTLKRLNVPCVLRWLDSGRLPPKIERFMRRSSTILTNSAAIGRKAAEYFLSSRYANYAYVGEPEDLGWSTVRGQAFADALSAAGKTCSVFRGPVTRSFAAELPSLGRWLAALPKPVGIFAVHDERARQVSDACSAMGISVPSEVGILGCDNDEELCEASYPSISSIAVDAERAAYLAARLLDGFMGKAEHAMRRITYGPTKVVERRSTMLGTGHFDPVVERTLKLIEMNITNGVCINSLCPMLGISRRQLERRFLAAGRSSLLVEINDAKLERAKVLLENRHLRLRDISSMLGFFSVSHFCKIYRQRYGETPRKRLP